MTQHEGNWEVEVFYDGECPLCMREMRLLMRRDRRARILFTNIAAPGFDPATTGRTWSELMEKIHGRLPNGEMIEGVEVFRRLYAAIGLRWAVERYPRAGRLAAARPRVSRVRAEPTAPHRSLSRRRLRRRRSQAALIRVCWDGYGFGCAVVADSWP